MGKSVNVRRVARSLGWKMKPARIADEIKQGAPWYVMVEGADGAGKSTFAEALKDEIRKEGEPCLLYHEPFYPKALLEPKAEDYQLDRERWYSCHVPDEKSWIVSDRSLFSTLAYNPCSGEVAKRMGEWLENPAYFGSYNKALIVLLPDEETLLKRLSNRQNEGIPLDALELDRAYQRKVAQKYAELLENPPYDLDAIFAMKPSKWRKIWK